MMVEYLVYAGAAIVTVVALNSLGLLAIKNSRTSNGARTEELHIAVKADTQEAMAALSALCDEARQLQELIDGRTIQSLAMVRLSAGDTVVLMTDDFLTPLQLEIIKGRFKANLPDGVEVVLLTGGIKISAFTKAQADE